VAYRLRVATTSSWYAIGNSLPKAGPLLTFKKARRDVHVGIVGAGLGGLSAAIAFCRAGARVTVLEAADQLGEVRHTALTRTARAEKDD